MVFRGRFAQNYKKIRMKIMLVIKVTQISRISQKKVGLFRHVTRPAVAKIPVLIVNEFEVG